MKEYKLGDLPESSLHIYGRNSGILDPLTLFWTASGVEVCVKASELWVEVEAGYDVYEPWISDFNRSCADQQADGCRKGDTGYRCFEVWIRKHCAQSGFPKMYSR